MHELGFFLVGLFVGSLATFGLMAIGKAAADADEWGEELSNYAGEGEIYDFTKDAARPFEDVGYRIRRK